MTSKKRLYFFIAGLFLSAIILTRSGLIYITDVNITLSKAKSVTGIVEFSDIRDIEEMSFRWSHFNRVFCFKLSNSDETFTIHNSYEGYTDLAEAIAPGDTIKVYFGKLSADNRYNRHVFQVEKGNNILLDYHEFSREAAEKAGMGFFIGFIFLAGFLMWFKRISIFRLLDSFVKPK